MASLAASCASIHNVATKSTAQPWLGGAPLGRKVSLKGGCRRATGARVVRAIAVEAQTIEAPDVELSFSPPEEILSLPSLEDAEVITPDLPAKSEGNIFDLLGLPEDTFSTPAPAPSKVPETIMREYQAPEMKKPSFEMPEFKKPDLPDLKMPEFKAPELPDFKAPELPKFEAPTLPDFKMPEFSLPKFSKPEFNLPDFSSPDFTMPELSVPEALKPNLPEVDFAETIKSKLPVFTPPELPKFELPSVGIERGALSKISLPPAVTEPVKEAFASATAAVEEKGSLAAALLLEKAAVLYGQLKEQVPEEYQQYVGKVESNLESFWAAGSVFTQELSSKLGDVSATAVRSAFAAAGYEVDEGVVNAVLITLGSSLLIVVYYRAVYGGYSGDLSPEEALKMLKDSNSVVLDVRPEGSRASEGILDLRGTSRFKERSLEFQKYRGSLRSQLRSPDAVDLQLFCATVKGLRGISSGTSMIVMDDYGSASSKDIARALARYGFERSYVLTGGFKAWASSGMRVKPNEPEAIAEILQNEVEAFIEDVKPTPESVLTVFALAGVGFYTLYDWQKSLQLGSFILAAQIIYSRAKTYETAADLQRDIRTVSAPFVLVATIVGWVAKQVASSAPKEPQLATASSSDSSADTETTLSFKETAELPESSAATSLGSSTAVEDKVEPSATQEPLELPAPEVPLELPATKES